MSSSAATRNTSSWHLAGPKPYEVQLEAMRRSGNRDKYAYFMEMGLGKTALLLNDYVENFAGEVNNVVVVCPNTFKSDWALAPKEWGLKGFRTAVWPDFNDKRGTASSPVLNSINFEAIRSGGFDYVASSMDRFPTLLVVDESSAIKNFKSLTAKAVLDLTKRAKGVRLLNGTPMSQNVMDLYPQLKCIGELDRMNPYAFRNRFAVTGGFMGKQVIGVRNEDELHTILDRCSFRALKCDWSDLPEKIYQPMRLEMTKKQRAAYKSMLEEFFTLVAGREFTANMVLTQMDKLRQITSGLIMDGGEFKLIEHPGDNPKIQAAKELLESGDGKLIIVHFYRPMGLAILEYLKKKGYDPSYIRGGMSPETIICEKHKFNNDPSSRVLVAQITASSKAHTLLGGEGKDRCSRMFFHDHTFSLGDRKQMEDRIHRGAQDRACIYFDPIMSPIDEAQLKALAGKQDIASLVVDAVRALR